MLEGRESKLVVSVGDPWFTSCLRLCCRVLFIKNEAYFENNANLEITRAYSTIPCAPFPSSVSLCH